MITILTDFRSPRLKYVADTIFKEWFNLDYAIALSVEEIDPDSCCIAYGNYSLENSIQIFNEGLLAESGLRSELPAVNAEQEDYPVIFENGTTAEYDLHFDVFSAVFFCLSRYEEYIVTARDEHERIQARDSVFFGHHRIPYLDRWILSFENLIQRKLPNWKNPRSLHWLSTMDMDIAFAFRGRSIFRNLGAIGKDLVNLRFDRLRDRASVLSGAVKDPYDTYDLFLQEDGADDKRIFIPAGDRSRFDNNLDVGDAFLREHIAKLQKGVKLGLHPSYQSLKNAEMVEKEKLKLEKVLGSTIIESRQHFLRLTLPNTFQMLQNLGIKKDYSLGFHDEVGFRSGTAKTHFFYDLKNESSLSIAIVPLTVMDSAMKNYMNLSTGEASAVMKEVLEEMKSTGGNFTTVWHNHSLSETNDWKGWSSVFRSIADIVRSQR